MKGRRTILQSLIWPEADICTDQLLYARLQGAGNVTDAIHFEAGGRAGFDTYFNLFNIGKWRQHCGLKQLSLVLSGQGDFKLEIVLTGGNGAKTLLVERDISLSNSYQTCVDIPLIEGSPAIGVLFFRLTAKDQGQLCCANWETEQAAKRTPDLAVSITTFKREAAIEKTVQRFEHYFKTSPYRDLIRLIVVDNGQSAQLEKSTNLHLFPNKNLGGSGGFARGMIEARNLGASHCLLMDDDATTHLGSIERTYQMLAYAADPALAIAGALTDATDNAILWENAAVFDGLCRGLHRGLDLRDTVLVAEMELQTTVAPDEGVSEKIYGGWWYFAFSLDQAKHLPFPFFVRGDDVSFSLANDFKIITLPGVLCFQDVNFSDKESPMTLYLDLRSHLAHQLSLPLLDNGRLPLIKVAALFVFRALIRSHYDGAEALNLALADLLRGPAFFAENASLVDRRKDIKALTQTEIWTSLHAPRTPATPDQVRLNPRSKLVRLLMILTFNGLLIPFFARLGNRITLRGEDRRKLSMVWAAAHIAHVDETKNATYYVTHSKRRAAREICAFLRHVTLILWRYPRLKSEWQEGYNALTESADFWEKRLKQP